MSGAAQAAACAVAGALCHPLLVLIGFDPVSAAGGLTGCLMAQTLLPKPPVQIDAACFRAGLLRAAGLTLGSVLFAAFANPVVASVVLRMVSGSGPYELPETNVRALCAVALGAFAQPIAMWLRSTAIPGLLKRLKLAINPPSGGGA